ncbi:uncharacterized protein LOC119664014 [Teleopsis dalmanni]|uniref:uncharacterized protein LOC119664014 n=1 Tax=Teleopsis dalmanni TaxID=139649 RepID=UPI0018CE401C|nr:uncharacterized protein LOC119664014 [Teleopsis dalmanni]
MELKPAEELIDMLASSTGTRSKIRKATKSAQVTDLEAVPDKTAQARSSEQAQLVSSGTNRRPKIGKITQAEKDFGNNSIQRSLSFDSKIDHLLLMESSEMNQPANVKGKGKDQYQETSTEPPPKPASIPGWPPCHRSTFTSRLLRPPKTGHSTPYSQNPYRNVREIVTLLPEFNPSSDKSLMPNQFIKRIDMLRTTYRWDDQTLVFAVQQKLQGYAKYWVDSQEVFLSWTEFATKFLKDFASTENIADIYIKMSQTKRQFNESPQEYYYKMMSLGTRGNVPENATARYIINGINEPRLKQKISIKYTLCNELLSDINIYTVYNDVQNFDEKPKPKYPVNTNHDLRDNSKIQTLHNKESETTRKVKCFNCSRIGHYSNKCPEPQRKERCSICNCTTHKETDCPSKKNNAENRPTVNKIENPGSAYTLIRETFAKDFKNKILRCSVTLSGFADGKFICTSKINAVVEFDNNEFITDLLIVDDGKIPENILLGRDVLCREGKRLIIEGDKCHIEDLQTSVEIPSDARKQLKDLLSTYCGVFVESMSELGKCVINKMSIKVNTDVPIRAKPYRIAFAKRKIVSDIVLDLLKNDIIRPSSSPYALPVVLVEKKNGKHRL